MLGAAVAETIMEVSPAGFKPASNTGHDFSDPARQERLGFAVSTAIRTINADAPYMHEMNDALVKMTLTYIQFAKDHDLLDDLIEQRRQDAIDYAEFLAHILRWSYRGCPVRIQSRTF